MGVINVMLEIQMDILILVLLVGVGIHSCFMLNKKKQIHRLFSFDYIFNGLHAVSGNSEYGARDQCVSGLAGSGEGSECRCLCPDARGADVDGFMRIK